VTGAFRRRTPAQMLTSGAGFPRALRAPRGRATAGRSAR
jgi:hypothetical protein